MTVNISTVGSGLDFDDYDIWEAATDINLVMAGDREEAEVHDNDTSDHTTGGATTDATNFRAAYPVAGSEWDPIGATGIEFGGAGFYGFRLTENFFRLSGLHISHSGAGQTLRNTADDFLIERCDIHMTQGNAGTQLAGTTTMNNCIHRTDTTNTDSGCEVESGGEDSVFDSCIFYDWQRGLRFNIASTALTVIKNCASVDCSSNDYFGTYTLADATNNLSSDTTAPGTSSQESKSATDTFVDPANDDFTMKAGSACIDNGVDTGVTEDFNGDTRTGTRDIGIYFDAAVSPPFLPVIIRRNKINPLLVR